MPISTVEWYMRWARRFALSMKGEPLRECSAEDVRGFLSGLETQDDFYTHVLDRPGLAVKSPADS